MDQRESTARESFSAGAHYDSTAALPDIAPGATDNAPAVAIVLEIARILPEESGWWLQWAYALRREQGGGSGMVEGVEAAREVLREPARRHGDVPLIVSNLTCYACVRGEVEEARRLLLRAFGLDEEPTMTVLDDPDLEVIFGADAGQT